MVVVEEFKKRYNALNTEQKQAVDTIDGPLLVIAGPGTGKTELLSVRVAQILNKTDTSPNNILCLTFTNKAANNMRQRLYDLIGPVAYKVSVHTFHSFAADIMNKYSDYFWNGARLGSVPEAVQLEIIQEILGALPLNNPLARKFAGELTGLKDTKNALKLSKEAGLTPKKLHAILDLNVAYLDIIEPILAEVLTPALSFKKLENLYDSIDKLLPEQAIDSKIAPLTSLRTVLLDSLRYAISEDENIGKTTNTGKWKQRFVQTVGGTKGMYDERTRNKWWLALSDVYQTYRTSLHERGYYDYADMLVEVIGQLEQNDLLRSEVQEQYSHVLIDEFQDTNAAQLRLAHLVSDHHTSQGKPNLMVVGDDDQSIYKFNGAELNNMLGFKSFYGINKPIVLTKNYRSSQHILDVAKTVAEQSTDRLVHRESDINKDLKAFNEPAIKGDISHKIYPTKQHQLSAVAKQIHKIYDKNSSIAVLARGHESLRSIAALLQTLNVPIKYEQQNDILQHPAVIQIILIAQLLVALSEGNEDQVNNLLSNTLRHPMWNIDAKTLWKIAIDNRFDPHWLESLTDSEDPDLKMIGTGLLELAKFINDEPLTLVLEYIIGLRNHENFSSPFKNYYLQNKELSNQYLETLSAVQMLRTMADEFSGHNTAKLSEFVKFIQVNKDAGELVTDETIFVSGQNAVELLSVHKAKGLEFDTVFIIDANETIWKPRTSGRKPPANLPLQAYGDNQDDYVRLFYVAATRAKRSLLVSSYAEDYLGKELLPAPFVRAAIQSTIIDIKDSEDPIVILQEASTWPKLSSTDESFLLKPLVEDYSLSVTAMLNFLDLENGGPQYFKERNLLRLPEAKSIHMSYGTAIHAALDYAQILQNRDEFEIEEILHKYEKSLESEHVSKIEFERYLEKGQSVLWTLLQTNDYSLEKGSIPEQSLVSVLPSGAKLGGKIDRIDIIDKSNLVIIDYKTGKGLSNLTSKSQNLAVKSWKHRTQLIYYALLAKNDSRFNNFSSVEGQMVYVESENIKDLIRSYYPSSEEVERMSKLATKIWQHIQDLNFPDVTKYPEGYQGILNFEEDLLNDNI